MARYAELLNQRAVHRLPPFPFSTRPTVIVARNGRDPQSISQLLPEGAPPAEFLYVRTASGDHGVDVTRLSGAPGSLADVERAVRAAGGVVVLLDGLGQTPTPLLRQLRRLGTRAGLVMGSRGWSSHSLAVDAAFRVRWVVRYYAPWLMAQSARTLIHRLRRIRPGVSDHWRPSRREMLLRRLRDRMNREPPRADAWRRAILDVPGPATTDVSARRVTLYLGSLGSGGAERQHGNLALGLEERGFRVRMRTQLPLEGNEAHYHALFSSIDVRQAGAPPGGPALSREQLTERLDVPLIESLPAELREGVIDLAGDLIAEPTDVLHCTLDYTNIVGGIAGLLVGVPVIVVSGRNVNPSNFAFYHEWMAPWYRFLAEHPHVRFIVNSHAGADDYARWLGIPRSRITVVLNGVNFEGFSATAAAVAGVRRDLGAGSGSPVIAGIFRLSWEKQPLVFLDVVRRVAAEVPGLKVALVGGGPMEAAVRDAIRQRDLEQIVTMLGQRKDVAAVLGASDILLLTSAWEGTPNVVLESQWLRRPVVATGVGGTPDTIEHGRTGYLHTRRDVAGLAGSVIRLLQSRALREEMGAAGHQLVRERFALDKMVNDTIALYDVASPPKRAERAH